MATEAEVLAILRGRKEFVDRTWKVYDGGGAEIVDPGGVLWRGVHGALLWNINLAQGSGRHPSGVFLFGRLGNRDPRY